MERDNEQYIQSILHSYLFRAYLSSFAVTQLLGETFGLKGDEMSG